MNLFELYAKISLDTKEYESAVKNATSSTKSIKEKFADAAKSSETLKNKIKLLASQYSDAKADVDRLTDAFNKSAQESGYTSEETQRLADELKAAESKASGFKAELDALQGNAEKTGGAFSNLGGKLVSAGKVAAKGLAAITAAAGACVAGLLSLESATEEYRIAQGKLNTAFEAAGYSTETASQAYTEFYKILGDTDTATEASQLLAKLADSEEDVATWTNIAAGVSGTFGDSLPIEGLIEAANETAKVGQVTGSLADALNWAGISEDEFNSKLAACSTESERNQLIMDTLSGTYDEASDAFYKNNEALVESRKNQALLDATMAQLGQTVANIKNQFLSEFIPSLSNVAIAFNNMISGVEGADQQFATAMQGMVNAVVAKLPEFLNMGVQILTSLASGIIQSIPTLLAAIPQIITQINAALVALFPQIVDMGIQLLVQMATGLETGIPNLVAKLPLIISSILTYITENLPAILDAGVQMLVSLVTGIINSIPTLIAALPQIISAILGFIVENLPAIVSAGGEILGSLISGIISAIPSLIAALPQIISAIVQGILKLIPSIIKVGKNIVKGLWEGIKSMASWLGGKVGGFFGGIINGAKKLLGIKSPSRVFAGIGKNMALGLGQGWENEYDSINKTIKKGMDFGTASVDFASSGLGVSSAGIINGVSQTSQAGNNTYTFNLTLPDGSVLASYMFKPLVNYADANGTPILNPI